MVTPRSGFDLEYYLGRAGEKTAGGYYLNAAQEGEPPGRWFGKGAQALGFTDGQEVERDPYLAAYQQTDPVTGEQPLRSDVRKRHDQYLASKGGTRPRNPGSKHSAIYPEQGTEVAQRLEPARLTSLELLSELRYQTEPSRTFMHLRPIAFGQ